MVIVPPFKVFWGWLGYGMFLLSHASDPVWFLFVPSIHVPTQRCHCQWIIRRYFHEWSHVNCDTILWNIGLRCLVDNGSALVFIIAWCGISDDSSSKTRGFSELYIRHQGHSELIRLDCLTNDRNNWTQWLKPWIKRLIQGHDYFNHRSNKQDPVNRRFQLALSLNELTSWINRFVHYLII